jgi:hypothetical protein
MVRVVVGMCAAGSCRCAMTVPLESMFLHRVEGSCFSGNCPNSNPADAVSQWCSAMEST